MRVEDGTSSPPSEAPDGMGKRGHRLSAWVGRVLCGGPGVMLEGNVNSFLSLSIHLIANTVEVLLEILNRY